MFIWTDVHKELTHLDKLAGEKRVLGDELLDGFIGSEIH